MLNLLQTIPFSFGALFPVVNPIGSAVIFLSLVHGSTQQEINYLAAKISLYTTIMLIVVLVGGSWILRLFGITIPIVLIGGGLILANIGWQLLNRPETPTEHGSMPTNVANYTAMAFYPLSMPVTAGPGCIAVAIALGARSLESDFELTLMNQLGNMIGIALVGITVYFCYRYAYSLSRRLGDAGRQVIMRLAAFINICIGLEIIWHGITQLQF